MAVSTWRAWQIPQVEGFALHFRYKPKPLSHLAYNSVSRTVLLLSTYTVTSIYRQLLLPYLVQWSFAASAVSSASPDKAFECVSMLVLCLWEGLPPFLV